MATITLTSSLRSVVLDEVVGYDLKKATSIAFTKIPGRSEPLHIDIRTTTTSPREYGVRANVSRTIRDSLLDLEKDREWITVDDGSLTDYAFILDVTSALRAGATRPYEVNVHLLSSSN